MTSCFLDINPERRILYVLIDFVNSFSSITNWYLLYDSLLVLFLCITLLISCFHCITKPLDIFDKLDNTKHRVCSFLSFIHAKKNRDIVSLTCLLIWIAVFSLLIILGPVFNNLYIHIPYYSHLRSFVTVHTHQTPSITCHPEQKKDFSF